MSDGMNQREKENQRDESSLSGRLARIETKLDMVLDANVDKEKRIRALERRDAYVCGVCVIVAMIAPIVCKKLFGI